MEREDVGETLDESGWSRRAEGRPRRRAGERWMSHRSIGVQLKREDRECLINQGKGEKVKSTVRDVTVSVCTGRRC